MVIEIVGAVLAVAGSLAATVTIAADVLQKRQRMGKDTTQARIGRLSHSLQEAVGLIDEMQQEIASRSRLVDKLQQDVDRYEELVKLKKPEIEAVAQSLREEVQREGKRSFWKSVAVNALFFVLGAVVTVGVTLAIG